MSSLRNAVKRVTHKERSQPQSRQHLGILEKKKDYKQRARDFHNKEDRIKSMQQKASMRNPDEFYFGMHRSEVVDGRHRKTLQARQQEMEDHIGADAIRIMKDQDLSYIRMQKQRDARKAERLQASLHFLESSSDLTQGPKKRKHTIFVDSKQHANEFDVASHFGTLPKLAGRTHNRPRTESLLQTALDTSGYTADADRHGYATTETKLKRDAKIAKRVAKKIAKARSSAYREMDERTRRVAVLERAEAHLVTEKLVAGKGRKRKIKPAEDGKPAVYKWRRKRQS